MDIEVGRYIKLCDFSLLAQIVLEDHTCGFFFEQGSCMVDKFMLQGVIQIDSNELMILHIVFCILLWTFIGLRKYTLSSSSLRSSCLESSILCRIFRLSSSARILQFTNKSFRSQHVTSIQ